ncbi:uncharacterized protein LOC106169612 [Lingula anatina]|uniref:Uncharacterized protein LOC106160855 n=1 Tax=Lingula anatina TaxID=7574 RepID=A0A1S3I486_LINAN|nr:uncharacterized protein LOC106160855 [Lingula anatina]XP_013393076.1 uncharacterized protein LOC106160855 [Lingula anatina]XP_013404579.1 uncharacterized protein LOC106169612 [Lingula anatina]XP_013404580.1 uncharacterized protein LOC106169612 [Lingula anatina]|eukprot:XP_013393075.1 uncharacterized protein LOC106160855 [Lingula anatina]
MDKCIVDADTVILDWAKKWYDENMKKGLEKLHKGEKLDWEAINIDLKKQVGDDKLRLVPDEGADIERDEKISDEDASTGPKQQRAYVLFRSCFNNDTCGDQEHTLRTERRTNSTCQVSISEGCRIGGGFSLNVPNPVIEANVGFSKELEITEGKETTTERELTWTLDSLIKVPAKTKITAEMQVKEAEYQGKFELKTYIRGRFEVVLSKNGCHLGTIKGSNLKKVFTKEHGFKEDAAGVYIVTRGTCHFRYGIEQNLRLYEEKLPGWEDLKRNKQD